MSTVLCIYNSNVATEKVAKLLVQKRYPAATFKDIAAVNHAGIDAWIATLTDSTYDLLYVCSETVAGNTDYKLSHVQYGALWYKMTTAGRGTLITSGTAQAALSTTSAIQLAATASAVNDYYKGYVAVCTAGTGVGQAGKVSAYTGATTLAAVGTDTWGFAPDGTTAYSVYNVNSTMLCLGTVLDTAQTLGKGAALMAWEALYPNFTAPLFIHYLSMVEGTISDAEYSGYKFAQHSGLAAAGGSTTTVKLDATPHAGIIATTAQIATDDYFNDMYLYVTSGTGVGLYAKITDYVGATRIAAVNLGVDISAGGYYRVVDISDAEVRDFVHLGKFKGRLFGDIATKYAAKAVLYGDTTTYAMDILNKLIDKDNVLNDKLAAGVTNYTPAQDLDYFWGEFMQYGYWAFKYSIV